MTIQALGYIKFRSHSVHVSKDSDSSRLYCFKQNGRNQCDWSYFDTESDACDYILEPLPEAHWIVEIPESE